MYLFFASRCIHVIVIYNRLVPPTDLSTSTSSFISFMVPLAHRSINMPAMAVRGGTRNRVGSPFNVVEFCKDSSCLGWEKMLVPSGSDLQQSVIPTYVNHLHSRRGNTRTRLTRPAQQTRGGTTGRLRVHHRGRA